MSKEINSERQSAPTVAQDSSTELNADRPLGGAACSASDFTELLFVFLAKHLVKNKEWLTPKIGYWAGVVEQQARGTFDVRDHYSNVRKACEEL